MNFRRAVGVLLVVIAAVWFFFVPALSVSSTGTQVIYWENITVGVILLILGIVLLATGRMSESP